jgi:hypothetical protein
VGQPLRGKWHWSYQPSKHGGNGLSHHLLVLILCKQPTSI